MSNAKHVNKLELEEWRRKLIQKREKGEIELADAIDRLEQLIASVDAVRLFVAVIASTSFAPEGYMSEVTHGDVPAKVEMLAYYAYPFFGKSQQEIKPWHINGCIEALDKILALRMIVPYLPKDDREPELLEEIVATVRMQAEVVRGSAFPEQTATEIVSIQGRFENWFKQATNIGPTRAQAILWSIIRALETRINSIMPKACDQAKTSGKKWQETEGKSSESSSLTENELLESPGDEQTAQFFDLVSMLDAVAPEILPVGLSDLNDLESLPTSDEWEGLINLIGMTKKRRESMSEIVEVRRRPLFVLPDNRVIIVDISNALDALWESFEQAAKTDQVFFSGPYQKEKTKWLQQKTVDCLSRIFPSQHIYQNLTYPDPDRGQGSTAELDLAVHWGPFLILLELKAKQFRLESQLGDIGRLRKDIKANVEDAFEQAQRAAKYIEETNRPGIYGTVDRSAPHHLQGRNTPYLSRYGIPTFACWASDTLIHVQEPRAI